MSHTSRRGRADWSEDGHAGPGAETVQVRAGVCTARLRELGGAGDEGHPARRWIMT